MADNNQPHALAGILAKDVGLTVQPLVNTTSQNIVKIECVKNQTDGTWTITATPS
jgi:hypothetical protein